MSLATRFEQGKKIRSGMTNGLAFWDPQEQTANQTRINIYIYIYIERERETSIQSNSMVYARKCRKRNSSNARLRAPIDLGYDLLDTKSIDFSIDTKKEKKKNEKKGKKNRDDEECVDSRSGYLLGRGCLSGSPPLSLCSFSLSFGSFSFS